MFPKIIFYSFALLFSLVPLFWSPLNFELFEFNKMILVYFLTVVITGAWILKSINEKQFTINRTPLDIPLLLFLGANILSTIFSIDPHTSIWGYYSRSNGGLLSIISYLFLYWALVSNISKTQVLALLKVGLASAVIVSLWGILEHFGTSLSCTILRSDWENLQLTFNADCWVQDVQARVFATLGQPNWMATYLGMLIFPSIYFLLTAKTKRQTIIFLLVSGICYLAFTFTYSRGPTLGLIGGLIVFILALINFRISNLPQLFNLKPILIILTSFLLINILFGSALTSFRLVSKFAAPTRPAITTPISTGTQLENGGTESGQIRFIVWEGALDIFKAYPILGSGVETFAYSYYQFRPAAHNLTSEWDFLYNKAHNEFLNYLANTGIVGFATYLFVFGAFIMWCLRSNHHLLTASLLASYVSYLVSNFFGFSVVITALFFFLFPALAFVTTGATTTIHLPFSIIFRHPRMGKLTVLLVTAYFLLSVIRIWYADTIFALGERASETGDTGEAYSYLSTAVNLRGEPYYLSEYSSTIAGTALALEETDATLSGTLKDVALNQTEKVLREHPKNTSFWRSAISTYYDLSLLDNSLTEKLLQTFDTTIKLAPTDPKILYNKAVVLGTLDRNDEAMDVLKKALELKPNYTDAYFALGLFYFDAGNYPEAVSNLRIILKIAPGDTQALDKLNEWGKEGIATDEANIQSNR